MRSFTSTGLVLVYKYRQVSLACRYLASLYAEYRKILRWHRIVSPSSLKPTCTVKHVTVNIFVSLVSLHAIKCCISLICHPGLVQWAVYDLSTKAWQRSPLVVLYHFHPLQQVRNLSLLVQVNTSSRLQHYHNYTPHNCRSLAHAIRLVS